jgi:hypothetical protein
MQLSIRKQIEINLLLHNTLFVKNDYLDKRISKILKGKYKFKKTEMENIKDDCFNEDGCIKNTETEINLLCSNLALPTEKIHKIYEDSSNEIHNGGWFCNKKNISNYSNFSKIGYTDVKTFIDVNKSIYGIPWNNDRLEIMQQKGVDTEIIIKHLNQDIWNMITILETLTIPNVIDFLDKIENIK